MHHGGVGHVVVVLKPEQLQKWREKVPPFTCKTGQTLFYEGHYPYGVYVIHSGTLALKARKRSRSKRILVSSGSAVGLDLILEDRPFPWTGVIQEDVEISFLARTEAIRRIGRRDALLAPLAGAAKQQKRTDTEKSLHAAERQAAGSGADQT